MSYKNWIYFIPIEPKILQLATSDENGVQDTRCQCLRNCQVTSWLLFRRFGWAILEELTSCTSCSAEFCSELLVTVICVYQNVICRTFHAYVRVRTKRHCWALNILGVKQPCCVGNLYCKTLYFRGPLILCFLEIQSFATF